MTTPLTAEDERHIRKMFVEREYYGAANDAIPALLHEVDRLRDRLALAEQRAVYWQRNAEPSGEEVQERLALAEQALEAAGHREDRLKAVVEAARAARTAVRAGYGRAVIAARNEALDHVIRGLDETTPTPEEAT
jgi:hypothetical protein